MRQLILMRHAQAVGAAPAGGDRERALSAAGRGEALRTGQALKARGVETAPLVFLASRIRQTLSRLPNATFVYRSIWDEDLAAHDMVYCFLSPAPMPRMYLKAKAEMRPGTLFVSNSFAVPDVEPERVVDVGDGRKTRLYLYRM